MQIIADWTEKHTRAYGREIMMVHHRLEETGLFTDDALIHLLDKHPSNMLDVCAMAPEPELYDRHMTVDFRGVDSQTLLDMVKRDQLWVNIREGMTTHPEYKEVMDQLLDELEAVTGIKENRAKCYGGILISSKTAKAAYHHDATRTNLWHIRGHKRAFIYPINDKFLPDEAYEKTVIGQPDEDTSYTPEFDKDAKIFDLYGGEMVTWPHPSPHRVENRTFCVSMVTEFCTRQTAYYNSVMFANGILRRNLGMNPNFRKASKLENMCKFALGAVLRKSGAERMHRRQDLVRYKLDPSDTQVLKPVEPFVRDF